LRTTEASSGRSADPYSLQNLQDGALGAFPHEDKTFVLPSRSQIDELAGFRRFALTGESGEAFTHARPAGCFRDRRLAPPKFLAPSAQPFEPGPGAFPLASGVRRLFAT